MSEIIPTDPIECLWYSFYLEDSCGHLVATLGSYRITKKTEKRIYFVDGYGRTMFVDRIAMEKDGNVYHRGALELLYADRADAEPKSYTIDHHGEVARLRSEMAAVHPDRGGSDAEFIAAHQRYRQAQARRARAESGRS